MRFVLAIVRGVLLNDRLATARPKSFARWGTNACSPPQTPRTNHASAEPCSTRSLVVVDGASEPMGGSMVDARTRLIGRSSSVDP